jgi:hypothetical protein
MKDKMLAAVAALAMLRACEAKIGNSEEQRIGGDPGAAQTVEVPAEGKAEDGRLSIKGPGFDMKIDIPEGVRNDAADGDNEILYPGAKLAGMHIEAAPDKGQANSGVELRFTTPDAPDKVAAWYRDPARSGKFTVASAAREGGAIVIRGTQKGDGDPFAVRLTPSGAGTEGRLTLSDKS